MSEEEFIIKFYSCDNEEQFLKDLYHNLNYLRQKNEQLKIQISAREEKYRKLENNWNELRKWIVYNKHNENTEQHYLVVDYGTLLGKMQELEKGKSE